ncbi:MAG TPA: cytochrome C [Thermoanaerobaculia bacterium]|nr:cytochrome C [Thermoanaerobaculia bacterium]
MKKTYRIAVACALFALALTLVGVANGQAEDSERPALALSQVSDNAAPPAANTEAARIFRGYQIAPVPLRLRGLDRDLVGLGSYIVNAQGGCNDCHTNPSYAAGHDPFMGQPKQVNAAHYLAGGQQFGPFTSRNITPDPAHGNLPAGLTFPQFKQVIRTGVDPENEHPQLGPLLQVMPWPTYQTMTDRDLLAIYTYLRAIPHAEPGTAVAAE